MSSILRTRVRTLGLSAGGLFALGLFSVHGCSSDDQVSQAKGLAEGCLINSDCNNPLSCNFGRCHAECMETRDCPAGELCVKVAGGSVCQLPDETQCTYSSMCPDPLKCAVDSHCRAACQGDTDCLKTQACVSHVCADTDSLDQTTHDLPHTNPQGGWNGVNDDGGAGLSDAGADAKSDVSVSPDSGGGSDGAGSDGNASDGLNPNGDGGPGAPSCSDGGANALSAFHPSNLPAPLVVPANLGDIVYNRTACTFDTDAMDWDQSSSCTNGFGAGSVLQVLTQGDGSEVAVLFAGSFVANATSKLVVEGKRPFVIATTGKVEINGTVTAMPSVTNSWASGGAPGPGSPARVGICASDTACGAGAKGQTPHTLGFGAGGGGYCGAGGRGSADPDGGVPASGGATYGSADIVPLLGGSSGGSAESFGPGNHGGGAIEIVAGTTLLIGDSGVINMGGGSQSGYGTGGGSGGAILLEAPSVTVRGVLAANGAGGGAYFGDQQDGQATDQPALGAREDSAGMIRGGSGSAGTVATGTDGQLVPTSLVSSGGGGGAGRIRLNVGCGGTLTVVVSAVISPDQTTGCYTSGDLH